MSDKKERSQVARPNAQGRASFDWQLTHTSVNDTVRLIMPPTNTLPVIFVPGIMGSNLKDTKGNAVWRLDAAEFSLGETKIKIDQPVNLARRWATKKAGARQTALHPERVSLDPEGAVPSQRVGGIHTPTEFRARGWGEVGQTSYHAFLIWLERTLNEDNGLAHLSQTWTFDHERDGKHFGAEQAPFQTLSRDDLKKRAGWRYPVYAAGYNWLESNTIAAKNLRRRIVKIIAENNRGAFRCKQVILVTHSMGGLVARACSELQGMQEHIAGIVHGVMPTTGAAVAYRRCKVGMRDEDWQAAIVIGATGQEVTAVFAQAPGALQLLPSSDYGAGWLKITDAAGKVLDAMPGVDANTGKADPYTDIYLRKDKWWGLVREEWLRPTGGKPIVWKDFQNNVKKAKDFHDTLSKQYHPNSFVFYGADTAQPSFESVRWLMKRGMQSGAGAASTAAQVKDYSPAQVRDDGSNPIYVGRNTDVLPPYGGTAALFTPYESDYGADFWELHCAKQDTVGDGTVPESSGKAPTGTCGGGDKIKQQFRLTGFGHEKAYINPRAQEVTLYAITKITMLAKDPK